MKALIAMSGGVDSSVAAALMLKRGYKCIGVTMKLNGGAELRADGEKSGAEKICGSTDDVEDARDVARRLGIPHYVFDFREEFRCRVMDSFAESYLRGETPNPCIECNRFLKFGALFRKAQELGCDVIVTGHYARVHRAEDSGRWELQCGADLSKDQSYFLYSLSQEQLAHICFPLGEYTKDECRRMAEEFGFLNAKKHDSQDICFIPDGNYKRFLEEYTGKTMPAGNFVDTDGHVLGRHTGICNYTIGQRKGLGIAFGHPVFVKEIRPETNEVVLSDNDALFGCTLTAAGFNWSSVSEEAVRRASSEAGGTGETGGIRCEAKVRYRHHAAPATAVLQENDTVKVIFDEPQRAITRGQAVVLYDGNTVIGGGTIIE